MPKDPYLSPETKRNEKVEISVTKKEKQEAKRLAQIHNTSVSKMLLPFFLDALDQLAQADLSKKL